MSNSRVIKQSPKRPAEPFDAAKLAASLKAACLSLRTPEGEAADIARDVGRSVNRWLENRPEVTSADIRQVAARELEKYHPDAAYLYKHHKQML